MTKPTMSLGELARLAEQSARNAMLAGDLPIIAAEHWQMVLVSVEARARLRGVDLPADWQAALTRYVGRRDG